MLYFLSHCNFMILPFFYPDLHTDGMTEKEKMPLHPNMGRKPSPADEEIQKQLRRILDSPEFHATDQQQKYLEFVVTDQPGPGEQQISPGTGMIPGILQPVYDIGSMINWK